MALAFCPLASACTVPKHMLVNTGDDPQNRGKGVRFHTTYYFRVFYPCSGQAGAVNAPYASDTLYRFQLTDKAHCLTTVPILARISHQRPIKQDRRRMFAARQRAARAQIEADASDYVREVRRILREDRIRIDSLGQVHSGGGDPG